jgi:hypothetical protein
MIFDYAYNRHKYTERAQLWLAYRLPRWLIYWAGIRLIAYATMGKYYKQVAPKLTAMDALKRWETDN